MFSRRGLNPPHRVKSISMATFTADEIENLRQKGNNNCKTVCVCEEYKHAHKQL
jgi:Arf-GAP domain and FG repeat-containing protein 1